MREGTDVLKALALGAKAVFVGRPALWGLAFKVSRSVESGSYSLTCMWYCDAFVLS